MVTTEQVRRLALALPDAVEQDHHGRPSFRVRKKIFATLWDDEHLNAMVDEGGIRTAMQSHPAICQEVHWGKRLAAVRVALPLADAALVADLLRDAWEGKSAGGPSSGRPGAADGTHPVRPARSRWTSFVADPSEPRPRILYEEGNPDHRVRVEHNRDTILVHLSGEDGKGWTVLAVDRSTRRWAVAEARRKLDAAEDAFAQLYGD